MLRVGDNGTDGGGPVPLGDSHHGNFPEKSLQLISPASLTSALQIKRRMTKVPTFHFIGHYDDESEVGSGGFACEAFMLAAASLAKENNGRTAREVTREWAEEFIPAMPASCLGSLPGFYAELLVRIFFFVVCLCQKQASVCKRTYICKILHVYSLP